MIKGKKNIAFFLPSLEGGGAEKNAINIFKNVDQGEYNISLILAEKQGDFIKDVPSGIIIFDLGTKSRAYFTVFLKLIKYLRRENPDILVSAFPHFNVICLIARGISGASTKIIITEHIGLLSLYKNASSIVNSFVSRFFLPIFIRVFYPKADKIICVSRGVASDISKIIKKRLDLVVINNPIDNEEIRRLTRESVGDNWLFKSRMPIIIMVGRLTKQKDYPTAFRALEIVNKNRKVGLAILGKGEDEERLKELSFKLGLGDQILFLGFQKNPYKYIKKSSVFLLSSIAEGFGNVLVEAMVCKTPVISTDCPFGPNEIIKNNKNGILVPVKNPDAIANVILEILDNPSLSNNLVKEGEKRAEDFSAKKIAEQYKNIFEKLCAE